MLKADFHVHTFYSKCSNMKPIDIVKNALIKKYDVLGVVDHNTVKGALLTKKIAGKRLLIIPGEEIMTGQGEVIVFLSDGKYNRNLTDIFERAKEMNHFFIIPHPFDFLRRNYFKNDILKVKPDAIEIFNSRVLINRFNEIAERYAEENKIPKIVGSDAHFIEEIGNATTLIDCESGIESIFKCIKKNKLKFQYRKSSIIPHFKSNVLLPIERVF